MAIETALHTVKFNHVHFSTCICDNCGKHEDVVPEQVQKNDQGEWVVSRFEIPEGWSVIKDHKKKIFETHLCPHCAADFYDQGTDFSLASLEKYADQGIQMLRTLKSLSGELNESDEDS